MAKPKILGLVTEIVFLEMKLGVIVENPVLAEFPVRGKRVSANF